MKTILKTIPNQLLLFTQSVQTSNMENGHLFWQYRTLGGRVNSHVLYGAVSHTKNKVAYCFFHGGEKTK